MTAPTSKKRVPGPLVAVILLILCAIGFFATVSNYRQHNPLTTNATITAPGNPALITATFSQDCQIQPGQRVLIRVPGAEPERLAGTIVSTAPDGTASIETTSPLTAPAGTAATISIEGTLPPQPKK
ncbi:MAG: hypothetical protein ACOYNG_03440 [Terrimicrobiaceae bacterium]